MELTVILFRLGLSVFIGGIVGYERSNRNSPAGLRTYILVSVSMTMISLIQLTMVDHMLTLVSENPAFSEMVKVDYGRLGAQALSGIGFLGAGTILHLKSNILGLTTAAAIWAVAIIGLALGMGYYRITIIGCFFIVATLNTISKFQKRYLKKFYETQYVISYYGDEKVVSDIHSFLLDADIEIQKLEFLKMKKNGVEQIKYNLKIPQSLSADDFKKRLFFVNHHISEIETYGS